MTNTRVERWFLFLRRIGEWQPSAEVTLGSSRDVIVSLFSHNLRGEVTLTNDLEEPLQIGNLTLRRTAAAKNEPAGISMYAMYLSGDETDAIIRGRTHICEWMQSGGTVKVIGLMQPDDLTFGCTTLELSAKAKLIAANVHFGRPLRWQPENSIGEANVKDEAQLIATDISCIKRILLSGLVLGGGVGHFCGRVAWSAHPRDGHGLGARLAIGAGNVAVRPT